jgi:hypothetical protein
MGIDLLPPHGSGGLQRGVGEFRIAEIFNLEEAVDEGIN